MGVKLLSIIRVYELAKQLNMTSKEVIELLKKEFDIEVKNHLSSIEGEEAKIIMEYVEEIKNKGNKNEDINHNKEKMKKKYCKT